MVVAGVIKGAGGVGDAVEPTEKDREKIEAKLLTGLGAPEKKNPKAHMPRGGTAI